MDHDDKLVGTILSRRQALRLATLAGASLVGAVPAPGEQTAPAIHLIATPQVEEGPFFVEEGLNRSNIATDTARGSVVGGSPLALHLTLYALRDSNFEPLEGAHVDIWHADAAGTYSDEASGRIQAESTKGQRWLRGYQVAGADGRVDFLTIYPGWYLSRTPHIHVKVRTFDAGANKTHEFNTQLFFDEATNDLMLDRPPYNKRGNRRVRNLFDGLYATKQADGTMVGSHLHWDTVKSAEGLAKSARFSLALKLA